MKKIIMLLFLFFIGCSNVIDIEKSVFKVNGLDTVLCSVYIDYTYKGKELFFSYTDLHNKFDFNGIIGLNQILCPECPTPQYLYYGKNNIWNDKLNDTWDNDNCKVYGYNNKDREYLLSLTNIIFRTMIKTKEAYREQIENKKYKISIVEDMK